jgi:hypothetical protein
MTKKPKPYLTREGQKWLKAEHAQRPTALGEQMLTHDAARDEQMRSTGSIEDNLALLLWATRGFRLAVERGRPVDLPKVLLDVASELRDADIKTALKRLRRRWSGRLVHPVVGSLGTYLALFGQQIETHFIRGEDEEYAEFIAEIEHTAKKQLEPAALEQLEKRFDSFEEVWRHAWPKKITQSILLREPLEARLFHCVSLPLTKRAADEFRKRFRLTMNK